MEIVTRTRDSLKRLWGSLNGPQKLTLSVAAVLMVGLLVWGSGAGTSDAWQRVVGHEVDNAERAEVLKSLGQKNAAYEVRNGGEIWVRKAEADRVVLELAGDGALSSQAMWKFLESSDVFATQWDKEKRFQLGLQRKLEYMIRQSAGVRNASVQITASSHANQVGFKGDKASASVLVDLKPTAELDRSGVTAIVGLVAHSVPGLDRDRVHVSDTRGRSYAVGRTDDASVGRDFRDLEARVENELQKKVLGLYPMCRVEVRAFSRARSEKTTEERHGKAQPRVEEERKTTEEVRPDVGPSDFKGAGDLRPSQGAGATKKTTSETRVENVVDRKFIESVDPSGQIEKVSVSALYPVMTDKDGKELGASLKLEDIRKSIMNVTGAAQDAVSVLMVPTRAPEPVAVEPASSEAFEWLAANWTKLALAALGLFALLVVARALRGALPAGEVEEIRAITARLGEPVDAAARPLAVNPAGDIADLRQGIRDAVTRTPDEAATALKSWMAER